jgi:transcriptional regulator with XRE-family HTH domain
MQESETPIPPLSVAIRSRREARRWSQQQVAEPSKIPQRTLSDWETGTLDDVIVRLRRLADTLGTTIGELCGDAAAPVNAPISGQFLVDLDAVEQLRSGKALADGQAWYAVVPDRHLLCTPQQYAAIDRSLPARWRRKKE